MTASIYSYEDFRKYLKDFYESQKKENRGYSYQKFSEDAGIKSPNYLKIIIDGQRNLSIEGVQKFAKALSLNFNETVYFENLVLLAQSEDEDSKKFYKKKIEILIDEQSLGRHKISRGTEIIHHPKLAVVLYLLTLKSPYNCIESISQRLNCKENEIKSNR